MCRMRTVVVASVLAGLLLLAALPAAASAGLAGFPYQRDIVVQENSGETLTLIVAPEPPATTLNSGEPENMVPGFAAVVAVIGLFAIYLRRKRT